MVLLGLSLFVVALFAFILSALCGGGASFMLIPLLGALLPGAQIPAALSIGTAVSSISRIIVFYRNICWKVVWRFVPPAIPAVALGAWLLSFVNPLYLEFILGLFLLSNVSLLFKKETTQLPRKKQSNLLLSFIGMLAGLVSGLTGAVGLLFNRFYLTYGLTKEEIVATRAANEFLLHVIKLILYVFFGLFTTQVLIYGLLVATAALISSLLMKRFLHHLSESLFRKVGYTAMVVSGLFMFINASLNIVHQNKFSVSYIAVSKGIETKVQWRETTFAMDFEYDEGDLEIEYPITLDDLPLEKQYKVHSLIELADKVFFEEVYGFQKHYYEAYVYKNGKLFKYDI